MKLTPWRGVNILITDRAGMPVLKLDASGNLAEASGIEEQVLPAANVRSFERLAVKVAIWIEWTAIEQGEFRASDIHPDIRSRVTDIAEQLVERDEDELEFRSPERTARA